jgi:hypothetical protein
MPLVQRGMTLITEFQGLIKRDFSTAINLSPTVANPLLDGEILQVDATAGLEANLRRSATADAGDNAPGWAVSTERGRYDTQAIGKVTVLFAGAYEADFRVWDLDQFATIGVGTRLGYGLHTNNHGDGVESARSVLSDDTNAPNDVLLGWCTRPPSIAAQTPGSIIRVYMSAPSVFGA